MSDNTIGKILILSTVKNLVPRVRLEKEALEKEGFIIEVFFRSQISWSLKTFLGLARYYGNVLWQTKQRGIDIVHLSHISQIPLTPILKLMRRKIVYDAYERYSVDISEKRFEGIFKKPAKWLIEASENAFVYLFIDAVLVVSTPNEYLRERYLKYCKLTECLYNVPSKSSVFRDNLEDKFNAEPLKIVYVGALGHDKGSRLFIPLAKEMREIMADWEMHLVLSVGPERERQRLDAEIEKSEISDFVKVHSFMEYNRMMRFLYNSHIGLNLTSNTKRLSLVGIGSSRKNYTYMSAGMVVITTDVGQMAYAIQHDKCGIVLDNVEDIESIALHVYKLNSDRKKAKEYARNGIDAISRKFNWEREQDKLLYIYQQLI